MAMPIRLTVLAALLLAAVASRDAVAEIEVQTGRVIGERFGSGPVMITADPFHKFDPMGGTRRLDRVLIDLGFDWECVVQLANPEPVTQEVRYNSVFSPADLRTNTDADFLLELFLLHAGTLIAEPFQTVQQLHTERRLPPTLYHNLDPNDPALLSMIGPGPIEFEVFGIGTAFDTRRWVNGVPMGTPNGFSVYRERWDVHLTYTYEYTVIPTPCAAASLLGLLVVRQLRRRPRR